MSGRESACRAPGLPGSLARFGRLAAEAFFHGIELGDLAQGLGGDRRSSRLMELIELAPGVGPACGKDDDAERDVHPDP